ncbi:MAG: PEP-CTERM sorting domain-containing protein [Chitinophagaceae bacterium]|nr:PEP-CTERM sorting domain-containing protein [Rubrivivax sp.]
MSAQAANVTLTGWAFGSGVDVATNRYSGPAGGFGGSLSAAGALDTASFIAYCIELEESFHFGTTPMTGYTVRAGADYFQDRRGDAGIAERLGRLFGHLADSGTAVDSAATSSALQLAVWNTVYDTDHSLTTAGSFHATAARSSVADSRVDHLANRMLAGAQAGAWRFDVFALERAGSQDFMVLVPRGDVPEPGSLALALAAFGALALVRRRHA